MTGKELTKAQSSAVVLPDYLTGNEVSGLDELGASDYKVPRIKLLQALSPETREFGGEAIPGHFWHTGLNVDMGDKLEFVPLIARKRVIVWRPQTDNGGGMLAFSANGKDWQSGGNQRFTINLKGVKNPVIWETKGNVQQSKLLEWGSSNPDDPNSAPAATMSYEYLCYFPNNSELGIAVYSCNKTALPKAKQFNTQLLIQANQKKPTYCLNVSLASKQEVDGANSWYVPTFRVSGTVSKEIYAQTSQLAKQHANYAADVEQEGEAAEASEF